MWWWSNAGKRFPDGMGDVYLWKYSKPDCTQP